jgi:hypothetical protein
MSGDIVIPPAALEAGAREICGYERDQDVDWREYIGHARAAITAALSAWTGAYEEYMNDEDGGGASVCVILPKGGRDD